MGNYNLFSSEVPQSNKQTTFFLEIETMIVEDYLALLGTASLIPFDTRSLL